jgi:L-lactate dehydrogenase
MLLAASDPGSQLVAPYGGIRPLHSPNPLAAGIPTHGDPIILDISMSTTAMGTVTRAHQAGQMLPYPWLLDNAGNLSAEPADVFSDPPGSILPLGGLDLGYKGFALGILVEALTSALAGQGRSEQVHRWGASVFLQLINPAAFGGQAAFLHETQWLADAVRDNPTPAGSSPVRLLGSRALQLRAEQLAKGVILYPSILPALARWLEKLDIAAPLPIPEQTP